MLNAPRLARLVEILDRLAARNPHLAAWPRGAELPAEVMQDAEEIVEARDLARELLEVIEWRRLTPPLRETEGEPRPLIHPRMWLLVRNPTDGQPWRSSFVPEGWELLQRPPLDLAACAVERLDHILWRWERR